MKKTIIFLAIFSILFLPIANAEMISELNVIKIWQDKNSENVFFVNEIIEVNSTENFSKVYFYINNYMENTGNISISYNNTTIYYYNISKEQNTIYYVQLNYTVPKNTTLRIDLIYYAILNDFKFSKKFYYNTTAIIIIVYPINDYELKSNDVQIVKATSESFKGAYITPHGTPIPKSKDSTITLQFSKIQPQQNIDDFTIYIIVLLFIFAIAIIGILVIKYKKGENLKEDKKDRKSKRDRRRNREEDEEAEISKKKKENLEEDEEIEKEIEEEKEEIEDDEKLLSKKKKLLLAIKKLDKDFENGELDKEIYEEMRSEYKKKVIEIMKKLE